MKTESKTLIALQSESLIATLKTRFEKNSSRHRNIKWVEIQERLNTHPDKLWSLYEMERTGGDPDVVFFDEVTSTYSFYD